MPNTWEKLLPSATYHELGIQQFGFVHAFFMLLTFLLYYTLEVSKLSRVLTIDHLDVIHTSTANESQIKSIHHCEELKCRYMNKNTRANLQASLSNLLRGTPKNSSKTFGSTLQKNGRSTATKNKPH